ncbi:hypothetical protein AB0B28_08310 [Glycomyces sp. NPDC046736]|uniref:hypothetical protein n=1 Tax=Glycomyces sp. NPDC046736 TaxID=3155615 RepID=UPI0033F0CCE9
MSYVIACAVAVLVGLTAGVVVHWPELRDLRAAVQRQAGELHTDDRTPRHPFTAAGPDDVEARNRIGGRR